MSLQVSLLAKAGVTQGALAGPLPPVDVPDVPLQVARDAEGALAELTAVGLLSGVGPQVPGQVGGSREVLVAEPAAVSAVYGPN